MRVSLWTIFVLTVLVACVIGARQLTLYPEATNLAPAQSDEELRARYAQLVTLETAGKHAEAVPVARCLAEDFKARFGPDDPEYAWALERLSRLLGGAGRGR